MAFKMTGWSGFVGKVGDKVSQVRDKARELNKQRLENRAANMSEDKKQRKTKRLDRRAARAIGRGNYEKAEKLANKAQLFDDTPQLTEKEKGERDLNIEKRKAQRKADNIFNSVRQDALDAGLDPDEHVESVKKQVLGSSMGWMGKDLMK
jgi:hypothetical protein